MKYFLIAVAALVVAIIIGAVILRRRREVQRIRRAELTRLRKRAESAESCLLDAEKTLNWIDEKARLFAETDHVMAGAINPILSDYFQRKLENRENRA